MLLLIYLHSTKYQDNAITTGNFIGIFWNFIQNKQQTTQLLNIIGLKSTINSSIWSDYWRNKQNKLWKQKDTLKIVFNYRCGSPKVTTRLWPKYSGLRQLIQEKLKSISALTHIMQIFCNFDVVNLPQYHDDNTLPHIVHFHGKIQETLC